MQKKRYGLLSMALVLLTLPILVSGCGGKAAEPTSATTMSPEDKEKAATDTQQGIAKEAARKQAEQASKAR